MKYRICIAGGPSVINKAKDVSYEFSEQAHFIFILALVHEALEPLRKVEDEVDIIVAGPSTKRICSPRLSIPVIALKPTFPDVIRAIKEGQKTDSQIGISLSHDERDFDINLLSQVMDVSLFPVYCDMPEEYEDACRLLRTRGIKTVIGSSFMVRVAEQIGIKGILIYKGTDMIRMAIKRALEICQIQHDGIRHISQLKAVMNNFTEGILLTDEIGQVILDNPVAQDYLGMKELQGNKLSAVLENNVWAEALKQGKKILNVIENKTLVFNYIPVRSSVGIHGLVCTIKRVDEVQDAEFILRRKLHDRGFQGKYTMDDIVGESEAIHSCKERAHQFAMVKSPILITGESGTGKELFAHSIHHLSSQSKGPFVAINCATLPSELLESELFGYEKGAFTGAHASGKKGLIEMAHKGTLFLDEIGSLSYSLQAKLLRLLSENEILKLGSDRVIPVDIRIISATNEDIESCVKDRLFRKDLYYRLNTFRLHIPPLRERPEDLFPMFLHFVNGLRKDLADQVYQKRQMVQSVLSGEPFYGNARELETIARRFCLLFQPLKHEGKIDSLLEICLEKRMKPQELGENPTNLKEALEMTEKTIIADVLRTYKDKGKICEVLNLDRSSLWRKIKKYKIQE